MAADGTLFFFSALISLYLSSIFDKLDLYIFENTFFLGFSLLVSRLSHLVSFAVAVALLAASAHFAS